MHTQPNSSFQPFCPFSLVWKIPPWSSSKPSSTVLGSMQRVAKLLSLPVRILPHFRSVVWTADGPFFALQTPPLMRCLGIYRKWGLPKRLLPFTPRPRLLWDGARPQPRFDLPRISVQLNSTKCPQQRHDILLKFYALMQEHHDDLGRIIVGYHPSDVIENWNLV